MDTEVITVTLNYLWKGKEVAEYCQANFENVLKSDPLFKTDVAQALKNTFKKIDVISQISRVINLFLGGFGSAWKGLLLHFWLHCQRDVYSEGLDSLKLT